MRYILPLLLYILVMPSMGIALENDRNSRAAEILNEDGGLHLPKKIEADRGVKSVSNVSESNHSHARIDPIILTAGSTDAQPGETVCVPVTVQNFDSVVSVQFSMRWNPLIFEFVNIQNINLPDLQMSAINTSNVDNGHFSLVWIAPQPAIGESFPDGTSIFEVCFEAVGSPGDMSDFTISGDPVNIEITTVDQDQGAEVNTNGGILNIISSADLYAEFTSCGTFIGESGGSFTITAFGGQPPYDIDWELSNDPTINGSGSIANYGGDITFTGLPPSAQDGRFYDVVITDANGDTFELEVEISHVGPPSLELMIDQLPCPGSNNGRISSSAGGQSGWTLEWSTGSFSPVITNLSPGVYSATLTDPNGCQVTDSVDLKIDSIDISASVEDASCKGVEDGSVTVTAAGGSPFQNGEYTFKWENRPSVTDTAATFSNITAGTYSVTVSDSSNCQYTETIRVGAEQRIVIENLNIDPVTCHGGMDGSISFSVSMLGGPGPPSGNYVFLWSPLIGAVNGGDTVWTANALAPGNYNVTIYDDPSFMGCQLDTTLTVYEPDSLTVTELNKQDESCNVGNDGFVTASANGGTFPYRFQWSTGDTTQSIIDLSAGEYSVTVTDANGCTDSMITTIRKPTPPSITSFDSSSISCAGGSDGSITVEYEEGNAPIQDISWSPSGSGATISGLSAGQYSVTITAEDGCIATDSVSISDPPPLVFDSLSITDPSCPGEPTGQIIAHASGGTAPYTFNWSVSGSADDPVLPSLEAGTYGLTVVDANDCPIDTSVTLTDPPDITATFSNLMPTSCFNTQDGSATVQASGGPAMTGNYTYDWSSGESGSTANMLSPGENYITVSDGICAIVDTVFINSPDSVKINLVDNQSVSCHSLSDGRLEVMASGGTGPYDYSWSNGSSTPSNSGLSAGSYTVEVTDDNGCMTTRNFVVEQPDSLVLRIDTANTFQISCGGYEDGLISLLYTGGNITGSYSFDWSPDVSDGATASDLGPGYYRITVSDENGCTDTTSTRLSEPPPIQFSLPAPDEPDCYGEETTLTVTQASGGTGGPYTFTINNTGLRPIGDSIDVIAGTYLVSVFDGGGCAIDTQITIDQPSPVEVNLPAEVEISLGDSILLQGEASSDFPIDAYQWSPPVNLNCDTCLATYVRPFEDQMYSLMATDVNGCQGSDEVLVRVNTTRKVYIPNIFTPNNDGINDHFEIFTGGGVASIETVRIFNRWGDLVYEGRNLPPNPSGTQTWDGTFNGKRMAPGVFVYTVEVVFLDGRTLTFRGDINLVR